MKQLLMTFLIASMCLAQDPRLPLYSFFQKRLADRPDSAPPSYESLLKAIDSIDGASASDISKIFPLLSMSLRSTTDNLPVEAAFALFAISLRPDGATLLADKMPEIATLLENKDDRLSGGAVITLRELTKSAPSSTIPIMISHLSGSRKPSFVNADIVSILLQYRPADERVLKAVDSYLTVDFQPKFKAATLKALQANHVATPTISKFVAQSLESPDKNVKLAAIYVAPELGSDTWSQALPALNTIANDSNEGDDIRKLAIRTARAGLRK